MADKLRLVVQKIRDKIYSQSQHITLNHRDKVDQLLTKYVPTTKVNEIAGNFKQDVINRKVRELVSSYEKFTGVEEIMAIQNTVVDAQEKFKEAQERRRQLGKDLTSIEKRLKELHSDMQNTMKGDEKYLKLCTEEHKLTIQEIALRSEFGHAEREERELFATMSAAVKLGHERERAHAERNKYWYIVASIFGTVLGIAGSTINNKFKMAEFRELMEQQMARSASILYTIAGGSGANASGTDITNAMKTEFAYQEQLAQNLRIMQENINHLVNKQSSLIDHINHVEHFTETQIKDLKRLIVAASQTSAKSDSKLTEALYFHQTRQTIDPELLLNDPNFLLLLTITTSIALLFGFVLGKIS